MDNSSRVDDDHCVASYKIKDYYDEVKTFAVGIFSNKLKANLDLSKLENPSKTEKPIASK